MNITNDLVTEYLTGFYEPVNGYLGDLRAEGEGELIPIILKETENFLSLLLALKKPKKILEVGTAIGYSAIYFAAVCPEAEIYTVEKEQKMYDRALSHVREAGLEKRISLRCGDGEAEIRRIEAEGEADFDFVFIDAAKSHYRRFFDAAVRVCTRDALIVSDNILQKAMTASNLYDINRRHRTSVKYMRQYLDYITHDPRFLTSLMSIGDGLALTIYRGNYETEKI